MRKIISISLLLAMTVIFLSACSIAPDNETNNDEIIIYQKEGVEQMPLYTESTNLRGFDEVTGECYIDSIFDKLNSYSKDMVNFIFMDTYANFILVSSGDDIAGLYAYYSLDDKSQEESYNVRIRISIYKTQSDAKERFKNEVFACTAIEVNPDMVDIGDIVFGDEERFSYIRGNIYVDVIGNVGITVVDLATAIDQQILEILNKQ